MPFKIGAFLTPGNIFGKPKNITIGEKKRYKLWVRVKGPVLTINRHLFIAKNKTDNYYLLSTQ